MIENRQGLEPFPVSYDLGMDRTSAVRQLKTWAADIFGRSLMETVRPSVQIEDGINIMEGDTTVLPSGRQVIRIGTYGLGESDRENDGKPDPADRVADVAFVASGVTLFHEVRHFMQNLDIGVDRYVAASHVSMVGNKGYYKAFHNELPYEVDAESNGVTGMWDALEGRVGKAKADAAMLAYVNYKAKHTSYMIPYPENGYVSREQVEDAFDDAYDKSISGQRVVRPLVQLGGEFNALLETRRNNASPYRSFFNEMMVRGTGEDRDELMCAFVLHLHPEVADWHGCIKDDPPSIHGVTGVEFGESSGESRARLGITGRISKVKPPRRLPDVSGVLGHISKQAEHTGPDGPR